MKLRYTGDFEKLKELGFKINSKEWFEFNDKDSDVYVYVLPVSKELKWGVCAVGINNFPTIVYDLINAGLVRKGNKLKGEE